MINVLLVHEKKFMLDMISSALEDDPEISVKGKLTNIGNVMREVREKSIDIIMISSRLPDDGTMQLLEHITQNRLDLDLVLLDVTETREEILRYIEAGASAYVTRNSSIDHVLDTVHKTYRDQVETPPHITAALVERLADYAAIFSDLQLGVTEITRLTDREIEVLELLAGDLSNYEIADRLVIEVGTVKNHVHNILGKLKVESRDEAANYLMLIRR